MLEHKRIERLMLFVELAQQLNYTRAAQALGISKGYLSEQIKKLENELQCPLLLRTTRSVRLTPEGERAFEQGRRIRNQVFQLERSVGEQHTALSGTLKITAPKMFAETYLFDLCKAFRRDHPGMTFDINCSYTTFNLHQESIDLAFRATNMPPQDMVVHTLFSYRHVLVAAPGYLARHGTPVNVSDLLHHNCLLTQHQRSWPLGDSNIAVSGSFITNENHLLRQQALYGEGIIRIAGYYVQKDIEAGRLTQVLSTHTQHTNQMILFYPQLVYPSQKLRQFSRFVRNQFDA